MNQKWNCKEENVRKYCMKSKYFASPSHPSIPLPFPPPPSYACWPCSLVSSPWSPMYRVLLCILWYTLHCVLLCTLWYTVYCVLLYILWYTLYPVSLCILWHIQKLYTSHSPIYTVYYTEPLTDTSCVSNAMQMAVVLPTKSSYKNIIEEGNQQARKPRSYACPKLLPTDSQTGVKCRATSVAKKSQEQVKSPIKSRSE